MKVITAILFVLYSLTLSSAEIKVMSFNSGSTPSKGKRNAKRGEFSKKTAKIADEFYGNGLSWLPAVSATKEFIAQSSPDIIGFQEMFDSSRCSDIPSEFHESFYCEIAGPTTPLVIEEVTSHNYQIACHLGDNEKCIAVKKSFGRIVGCDSDVCLDNLEGEFISNCGQRSRVGRAEVLSHSGESFNIVHLHGNSGFAKKDQNCRKELFKMAFDDLKASKHNIVLGDFNTDPRRLWLFDKSARKLRKYAKKDEYERVSKVLKRQTYAHILSIDHIYTDKSLGLIDCKAYGVSKNTKAVIETSYFDHVPLVCRLETN